MTVGQTDDGGDYNIHNVFLKKHGDNQCKMHIKTYNTYTKLQ